MRTPFALSVLALVAILLPGCVTNPATGSRQLNYLSQQEEIQIGQETTPQVIEAYGGELPDERIQRYVSDMGQRIAAEVEEEYRDLPWEFTVLNSEIINAFALPGGKVFISRGLLEAMNTEAQLAGVLGHEIGHVTAEHHDLAMQRQLALAGIAVGAGVLVSESDSQWVDIAAQALVTGSGIYALTYSRDQERESDTLGLRYMTRAGYNPRGLEEAMRILDQQSGGQGPPEWLSTHPNPGNRAERLSRIIGERYASEAQDPLLVTGREAYEESVLRRLR